jgi:hypothetical protein
VGTFDGEEGKSYEIALDVEHVPEIASCNPRVFISPTLDSTVPGFLIARTLLTLGIGLWLAGGVCLVVGLLRRRQAPAPGST